MRAKTLSANKIKRVLQDRIDACVQAAERYKGRYDETHDAIYDRMAATERCAALELRHVYRLLLEAEAA
jgi:hypothetical protein